MVLVDFHPKAPWGKIEAEQASIYYAGVVFNAELKERLKSLADLCAPGRIQSDLEALVFGESGQYGFIFSSDNFVFSAVDSIRSFPIFYAKDKNGKIIVSNDAYQVVEKAGLGDYDDDKVQELVLAGYVSDKFTAKEGLFQLKPGEKLVWKKGDEAPNVSRHYVYIPDPVETKSEEEWLDNLAGHIDRIIDKTIEYANGSPICVPLSAGLDSRIILAKLVEKKYDNLTTFTYGIKGNHEAFGAKKTAETLGVPWFHLYPDPQLARKLLNSQLRKDFWKFGDGLCSIPSLREFEPIWTVTERKLIPSDCMIVNGQSGDYITGGHLPELKMDGDPDQQTLVDHFMPRLLKKHYGLWPHLFDDQQKAEIIEKIYRIMDEADSARDTLEGWNKCYEFWEWQERQSKYVCNGQRVYDFFGYRWDLPLWDSDFMEFWKYVPFDLKYDQYLYKQYLKQYNYRGMFDEVKAPSWTFPKQNQWVIWSARFIGLFGGQAKKDKFYKKMGYFGSYHHQYALFGYDHYAKRAETLRNPISLLVELWTKEHGLEISDQIFSE